MLADEGEIVRIVLHLGPGQALGFDEGLERFLARNRLGQFETLDREFAVAFLREVVRIDERRRRGIGVGQPTVPRERGRR